MWVLILVRRSLVIGLCLKAMALSLEQDFLATLATTLFAGGVLIWDLWEEIDE